MLLTLMGFKWDLGIRYEDCTSDDVSYIICLKATRTYCDVTRCGRSCWNTMKVMDVSSMQKTFWQCLSSLAMHTIWYQDFHDDHRHQILVSKSIFELKCIQHSMLSCSGLFNDRGNTGVVFNHMNLNRLRLNKSLTAQLWGIQGKETLLYSDVIEFRCLFLFLFLPPIPPPVKGNIFGFYKNLWFSTIFCLVLCISILIFEGFDSNQHLFFD